MTTPFGSPPRASAVQRYGPLVLILVAIVLLGVLTVTSKGTTATTASSSGGTAPVGTSKVPVMFNDAKSQGGDLSAYGDRCDPATGRIKMPTIFAPPCVPVFSGDNGGATTNGVTRDTIKVVVYVAQQNGDLSALLQGLLDKPEDTAKTVQAYNTMFQTLYETYGRKIELVQFNASGAANDETAARADAVKVASDIGAFASIGGPAQSQSYADELTARKVLCFGCGLGSPDKKYQDNAPYMWGSSATPEEFLLNVGDLVAKRLNNKPASFGGDDVKDKQRVFGVVHYEQEVPVFKELGEEVRKQGDQLGMATKLTETYTLDLAKAPERSRTIIAKMKEAGVTSIIFLGDPIMPISLTQAATEQNYFPEWIVTGTVLTDTTTLARRYDQKQWAHAFGISSLPARIPREKSDSYKLHQWYFGATPAAPTAGALTYPSLSLLYLGIHLAGPNLTAETFRDGLFRYPPTGGGPTTPGVSFGRHGYFINADGTERTDYLGVDDVTLIWWDTAQGGPDESGKSCTGGAWRYMDGGKRYLPGKMPTGDLPAFDKAGTVLIYDGVTTPIPQQDVGPDYPRPANAAPLPYDPASVTPQPPSAC